MSYLDKMVQQYVATALQTSINELYDTSCCDKCAQRVKQFTNSKGTEWREVVHEMDADCPEGGAHEVAEPEDHSETLDGDYGVDDLHPETLDAMREDCTNFLNANREDLAGMDPGQAGHDFWLTRHHHGAGFWDRGLGDLGDRLTKAAHPYGDFSLWVDDGTVRHN